ncbi:MAG TPA: IS110 family transposase, partial [Alcanivorax sp.]|nr:IS110 family transposase [Alcanivorax sp.]
MAARRHPYWASVYQRYRDRGLQTTQALVILARKLARIAFALMKNQTTYQAKARQACGTT